MTHHNAARRTSRLPYADGEVGPVLHVFDMDGTLLPGTTASLEIARAIGGLERLHDLEAAFRRGVLDTKGFAAELHRGWEQLTPEVVRRAFDAAPKLTGIEDLVGLLHDRGDVAVVISMSPDFFVRQFLSYGFDEAVGSTFPPLPFREELDPAGILSFEDKPKLVHKMCERYGILPARTLAYGDSQSDVPLFKQVGISVAVNADAAVRSLATVHYAGEDLRVAARLGLHAMQDLRA